MKILITGAKGFMGRNLTETLRSLMDGRNRTRPNLRIEALYLYDVDTDPAALSDWCGDCDFVFHLAGVNRPKDEAEFTAGNVVVTERLLALLRANNNACPVMLSSSIQASGEGRFKGSVYGQSKARAEELVFRHAAETGATALVFRLPNLFGKWSRPDYNSVVATFCFRIARGLPIEIHDPDIRLSLLYVDDLVNILLDALEGRTARCRYEGARAVPDENGPYRFAPGAHDVRLGELAECVRSFAALPRTLTLPEMPEGSLIKKLYSTYLSFLPPEQAAYPLEMRGDARGSFTELVKTASCGQFSVNVSNPGITKGQHWHHSKWELFIVVSGEAMIREREIGGEQVFEFRVSGDNPTAVRMLPGYTHSIVNLSNTEKLITLMWANERFDPSRPDTFSEPV